MTLNTRHAALVSRLVKSPEDLFAQITPFKVALIHSVLGIAGELGELEEIAAVLVHDGGTEQTRTDLIEEAGDFVFYATDIRHVLSLPPFVSVTVHPSYRPAVDVGIIVDISKKIAIYNQPVTDEARAEIGARLDRIESHYEHELTCEGSSRNEALEANIEKLNIRYPEGYSDQAAEARADKA